MIAVTKLACTWPEHIYLEWTTDYDEDATFEVLYRESEGLEWAVVATDVEDVFYFHTNLNFYSVDTRHQYKVRSTRAGGVTEESEIVKSQQRLPRRLALARRKAHRDLDLRYRLNGTRVAVLKRKWHGERCTQCYDAGLREVLNSFCLNCYSTSIVGGYYTPVVKYMYIISAPMETPITVEGRTEVRSYRAEGTDVPYLSSEDMIIALETNHRYEVTSWDDAEIRANSYKQTLNIRRHSNDSIIYKFPIESALQSVSVPGSLDVHSIMLTKV